MACSASAGRNPHVMPVCPTVRRVAPNTGWPAGSAAANAPAASVRTNARRSMVADVEVMAVLSASIRGAWLGQCEHDVRTRPWRDTVGFGPRTALAGHFPEREITGGRDLMEIDVLGRVRSAVVVDPADGPPILRLD